MYDAFDGVAAHVRSICNDEAICVHVDNAQECEIKRHPQYDEFRSKAVASRAARTAKSRLWDSMVAMGRLSDMRGDDKWRMIVVDCLTPFLRTRSETISRNFYADLYDIRSEMFTALLDTWATTATGVAPREVPTLMAKAATSAAYRYAKAHGNESAIDDFDALHALEDTPQRVHAQGIFRRPRRRPSRPGRRRADSRREPWSETPEIRPPGHHQEFSRRDSNRPPTRFEEQPRDTRNARAHVHHGGQSLLPRLRVLPCVHWPSGRHRGTRHPPDFRLPNGQSRLLSLPDDIHGAKARSADEGHHAPHEHPGYHRSPR